MSSALSGLVRGLLGRKPEAYRGREQVLSRFESLGYNCEFGLAQRYAGLEPLGLFRFTSAERSALVHGLETDFAAYGSPGDLELFDGPEGHIFCRSRALGYTYNTMRFHADVDAAALAPSEYQKVAYLKARFLDDLRTGEKIFVRVGSYDAGEAEDLARALRRHGPAHLLYVNQAGGEHGSGTARSIGDGVIEGFMDRSRRFDVAGSVPLGDWIRLCLGAHALVRGAGAFDVESPEPQDLSEGLPGDPIRHAAPTDGTVVAARTARHLAVGAMHAASAWIWLPEDFTGTRVALDFLPIRFGYQDADLSRRGCWQRVWASCKPRKRDVEVEMRLVSEGGGSPFWSAGWRLETGPLPSERPPPTTAPSA